MTKTEAAIAVAERAVRECRDLRTAPFVLKQYVDAQVREMTGVEPSLDKATLEYAAKSCRATAKRYLREVAKHGAGRKLLAEALVQQAEAFETQARK